MKLTIYGIVQGVGFRPTVHRVASRLGAHGYVQNNGSNVVVEVDIDPAVFLHELRTELPPLARVDRVEITPGLPNDELARMGFRIVKSESGEKGVAIPNDFAICDNCLREMFDPQDRRYQYPFTNCTDCGARFTIIDDLPYDREKTSMRSFPMCDECEREYEDVTARRFHHQTVSCPKCGPKYYLLDKQGIRIEDDPLSTFVESLVKGKVGIIKSWGGMHICCTLPTLPHLREWYHRKEKPFAVMMKDLDTVRRYAEPTEQEVGMLTSGHRPIVLVKKIDDEVTELISPGLGNIGVFLPYTEMQQLLFSRLRTDALVMTSANVPGEPMVLRDEGALSLDADVYLMHDREIINRCDDSVVRSFDDRMFYIRRSRGFVPFDIPFPFKGVVLGLGAQENIAGSLSVNGRLHVTQYIGDSSSAGVLDFLESSVGYLRRLLGVDRIDAIGVDLHPGYSTRRLGLRMAEELDVPVVEVQHHYAHALALMLENTVDELVTVTVDGTGYGTDGKAWGGEVLDCGLKGFERVGHLQEIPLLGGEKAVYDVRRLEHAIERHLGRPGRYFSAEEKALFDKMTPKSTTSTSLGRLMDATACALDICNYRSYDGEPAMKLERWLSEGQVDGSLLCQRKGGTVLDLDLFEYVLDANGSKADVAASYMHAVLQGLMDVAIERAERNDQRRVGLTGGVSYNYMICRWADRMAKERGLELVLPRELPNGDGCISAGQCVLVASSNS